MPIDAVQPFDELPKVAVAEFVDQRGFLHLGPVARAKAHRVVGPAGVTDRIGHRGRYARFRKLQTGPGLERGHDAVAVLLPDRPVRPRSVLKRHVGRDEVDCRLRLHATGDKQQDRRYDPDRLTMVIAGNGIWLV